MESSGPDGQFAALMFLLASKSSAVFSDDMSGHADIIDGDTLEIHVTPARLWGIDALASSQLRRGGR
jgi:endonuclease YncB( thermonuclease family)